MIVMIQLVIKFICLSDDNQVKIIVAVLGLVSALVVSGVGLLGSAITILITKKKEQRIHLQEIKEKQYVEFLESIADVKSESIKDKEVILRLLSARIQSIYLVGDINVQKALKEYLSIFQDTNVSGSEQSVLYANLISAMKRDLYGEKSSESLESINLTIFR